MEHLLNPSSYSGLGILLIFALFPGVSMVSVKGSDTILAVVCSLYFVIFIVAIVAVWLTFKKKVALAPKWLVTTVMLLLIPYYSALSTAIESFGQGNKEGNYWPAIAMVVIVLVYS